MVTRTTSRDVARALGSAVRDGRADSPSVLAARLLNVTVDAVRADGGALMLMDPQTLLFSTGAVDRLPASSCHAFFASELDDTRGRTFRRLAGQGGHASALSNHPSGDETFRRTVLQPFGYADEVRVVCRDAGVVWAGMSLWRKTTAPPFTGDDERILDAAAPLIGTALRDAVLHSFTTSADSAPPPGVQGVMVLDGRRVVEASPEARTLLREIDNPATPDYRPLDHLLSAAQRDSRFTLVVGARDGRWITAHATALSGTRTAVVLMSASPADLFGTLAAGAGLTTREVEVTRLLCRGLTDAEIAHQLTISNHTAHDHVRSVRRKLGVRNRSQVSSKIFADHYFNRLLATAAVTNTVEEQPPPPPRRNPPTLIGTCTRNSPPSYP